MTASDAISFRAEPVPVAAPAGDAVVSALDHDNPQHTKSTPRMRTLVLPRRREDGSDRWLWIAVALGVAALYFAALMCFWAPANPGTDQNGYFVGGRQFAHTLSSGLKPESDYGFVGRMWILADNGVNYPKYPLGLPILFAACLWIFGEARGVEIAHLISPISAALATLGVFALTRRLAGGFMGVMAMLLLACGQTMLTLAVNPNSHAACTCAVVWGIYFLIRWLETGTIWRGVVAGGLLGVAYTIRYTEGLLLLPLGVAMIYAARWARPGLKRLFVTLGATAVFAIVAMGFAYVLRNSSDLGWLTPLAEDHARPLKLLVSAVCLAAIVSIFVETRSLVRLLAIGFAWLVPVAYLTIFNMVAMRSFTSYAGTNESTGFTLDYFRANWEKMIRVIHDQGLFFIAPIGVLGLICMFRRLPLVAAILTLWFLPSVLLYTAYYWAPDNMGVAYSRFILTQLPALVIAAAWLMGEVTRRLRAGGVLLTSADRAADVGLFLFGVAASLLAICGITSGSWRFTPQGSVSEGYWWSFVPTGATLLVVGLSLIISRLNSQWRIGFLRQFAGASTRLGVALIVFISCALGTWRTVLGSEWGQRIMIRANIEIQARQNMNLAGLGRELRRAVDGSPKEKAARAVQDDSDVILFGDGERLNHLQWIGGWQLFSVDAFNYERSRGLIGRGVEENDPDPIDPSRTKFLQGVYKGKDQRSLQADENALIANALNSGKRVYYVLTENSAKQFGRQIDRRQFEVKDVGTYTDVPPPRTEDDFLSPGERPKQPVNRFGRGNPFAGPAFAGFERMQFKIAQVVKKQTTQPASQPSMQATTAPAK